MLLDLAYAVRRLAAAPAITAAALLTAAVGIGSNVAVFGLVNQLMLQPPPGRDPERMVNVLRSTVGGPSVQMFYPDFEDLAHASRTIEGLLAYRPVTLAASNEYVRSVEMGEAVSENYFSALDVRPVVGRAFDSSDAQNPFVVVLSFDWWTHGFAHRIDILGTNLRLQGIDFSIIGVAPPGFRGLSAPTLWPARYFVPARSLGPLGIGRAEDGRSRGAVSVRGWLSRGVSIQAAQSEMRAFAAAFDRAFPSADGHAREFLLRPADTTLIKETVDAQTVPMVLAGVTAMLLLLLSTCTSVVHMLLARASSRTTELAIRGALGASRRRLVQLFVLEHGLLAVAGGTLALVVGYWGSHAIAAMLPPVIDGVAVQIEPVMDWHVWSFAALLTTGLGGVIALAPACVLDLQDVKSALTGVHPAIRARRKFNVLVAGQVAISVVLIGVAGLLLRSAWEQRRIDWGLNTQTAVVVDFDPFRNGYDESRATRFYFRWLEDIRAAAPGTIGGIADAMPGEGVTSVSGHDESSDRLISAALARVTDGALEALGVRLLNGRLFAPKDLANDPTVAVVSQTLAETLWPGTLPVGQVVRCSALRTPGGESSPLTVVGVVRDAGVRPRGGGVRQIYLPLDRNRQRRLHLVVSSGPKVDLMRIVVASAGRLDAGAVLSSQLVLSEYYSRQMFATRLGATMLAASAAIALALAAMGVYGTMMTWVSTSAHDFAVRVALGARRGRLFALVLSRSISSVVLGAAGGLVLLLNFAPVTASILFGVHARDPQVMVGACALVVLCATAGCALPARRAASLQAVTTLRSQ